MDMTNVFIGKYKDITIAISSKEKLIHNYMETHRSLTRRNYEVEEKRISETELMLYHEDRILTEYYGYYIPNVDVTIIEMYGNSVNTQINQAIEGVKNVAILANQVKKLRPEVEQMVEVIKMFKKLQSSQKTLGKLNYQDILLNSILFIKMDEYLRILRQYEEMSRNNQEFLYHMTDEGEF